MKSVGAPTLCKVNSLKSVFIIPGCYLCLSLLLSYWYIVAVFRDSNVALQQIKTETAVKKVLLLLRH